ncbi:hypothetical protein BCR43DRAFT_485484 [Syncephalastrum racemosum]|uniref:Uncharacterized protein n=1 Tax=Syncephalastrum racemosum TaxID=13706 RepID=A0A1X2HMG2_SYNRA|nr:hypothetical protein BCR43DRAFT_485484 [Syncephalastrum racemosum]
MLKLREGQSSNILAMKTKHQQDMEDLKQRLAEAEAKAKESAKGAMNDEEIERILEEFEQAQHTHAVQIEHMQQSHESELSSMQQDHVAQLTSLKKAQNQTRQGWTSRYLPTEAVSWPAPQQVSLRKTTGPKKTLSSSAAAATDLTPKDVSTVQVYVSSVSANASLKQKQEHLQQLLHANNISFDVVDVAANEAARERVKESNDSGVPQIYVGGQYRGQYEDLVRLLDDQVDLQEDFLRPAAKVVTPPASPTKTERTPKPVRAYRGVEDDDEALFKELEQELSDGKIADLDAL